MVVAPAAGRQALQLEVGVEVREVAAAAGDVAGVVEDGGVRVIFVDDVRHPLTVAGIDALALAQQRGRIRRVLSQRLNLGAAGGAVADADARDVKEDLAGVVLLHDLLHLGGEQVEIGGVVAEEVVPRAPQVLLGDTLGAEPVEPLRVGGDLLFVKTRRDVDRGADADLGAGLELRAQQVEGESGVHPVHRGGVVGPAVVALGKDGDGVDMPLFESGLELLFGKTGADPGDGAGGVEIQVNLTERQHKKPPFVSG